MAEQRVAAVTGGARGIGRAIATELTQRGWKVAVGDLRAESDVLELDVTDRDSFERFLDAVAEGFGRLDVLVNNAGIMTVGALDATDPGAASKQIDVNVKGVLYGMQLAIPRMSGGGHIVNVVSSSAWVAPPFLAAYSASKHAARGLTDAVRDELKSRGIHVTAVYPGVVDTDLAAGTGPARGGKMIAPAEVGAAVADAIAKPRAEVFVPRSLGPLLRLYAAMPPRGRALLGRLFGVQELYASVDPAARREYESTLG